MKTFLTDGGWKHFFFFIFFTYILLYWGHTHYAHNTLLFPSSMLASLDELRFMTTCFLYIFFVSFIGTLIEWHEAEFFSADWSWSDIIYGAVGAAVSLVIFHVFRNVPILFTVSLIGDGIFVIFILQTIYKRFFKKTSKPKKTQP